jgi:hypothetical protein
MGIERSCTLTSYSTVITLVSLMNTPQDLDVDDTNVYFTDTGDNSIWRVPKTGGTAVALATGQSNPTFLALDSQYVYWNNAGALSIARVPKAGGAVETVVTTSAAPVNIALDDVNVYWIAEPVQYNGGFYSAPKAGGGTESLVGKPVNPNGQGMNVRAANSRLAYPLRYADVGGSRLWSPTGLLFRNGGDVVGRGAELYEGNQFDNGAHYAGVVQDITSNSCARYWITPTGVLRGYSLSNAEQVASATQPRHVAADGQFVYWTEGRAVRKATTGDNQSP